MNTKSGIRVAARQGLRSAGGAQFQRGKDGKRFFRDKFRWRNFGDLSRSLLVRGLAGRFVTAHLRRSAR